MLFDPTWTHAVHHAMFLNLIGIATVLFAVIPAFQIITLPVKFDTSRRAKQQLARSGIVHSHEGAAVSQVLNAAALTYVAAMLSAVMELLYPLSLGRSRR